MDETVKLLEDMFPSGESTSLMMEDGSDSADDDQDEQMKRLKNRKHNKKGKKDRVEGVIRDATNLDHPKMIVGTLEEKIKKSKYQVKHESHRMIVTSYRREEETVHRKWQI